MKELNVIVIGHHEVGVYKTDQESLNNFFKQQNGTEAQYVLGCYRCKDRDIYVLEEMCDSDNISVLMHEIMEAISDIYEIGLEHNQLSSIAEHLAMVMGQNPEFFKQLFEEYGYAEEQRKEEDEDSPRRISESSEGEKE